MDITPYVESLRRDVLAAAEAAGPDARALAERLTYALDPAARLAVMEAISQAAAEITAEMPSGGVDVRLEGRELAFVVDVTPAGPPQAAAVGPAEGGPDEEEDGEGAVARITLRLPESVKSKAEDLAAKAGQSLNTWIVNALRMATREQPVRVDIDLSSIPFGGFDPFAGRPGSPRSRRMTGWL